MILVILGRLTYKAANTDVLLVVVSLHLKLERGDDRKYGCVRRLLTYGVINWQTYGVLPFLLRGTNKTFLHPQRNSILLFILKFLTDRIRKNCETSINNFA